MSPKEVKRKRGRPPATSPPASPKRFSSRASSTDYDAKRRREKSPLKLEQENEDELSENDEVGETKIDKNGKLLGGREYKVPTFKLPEYGDQELMLAMDPSKLLGYRDSYLFFQRNPTLKRVRISEEEKNMLVKMGLLVAWFKGREVAVVTARSVFKRFGSKVVKNGKRVVDDYFENRQEMEEDNQQPLDEVNEMNTIGHHEYHFNEAALDNRNWIYHAALATRGFNAQLQERRTTRSSFYDIHSDVNQVPLGYQPRSCRFEFIKDKDYNQESVIEYRSVSDDNHAGFRGVGKDILDYNLDEALKTLPEEERNSISNALQEKPPIVSTKEGADENYPLAIMDGQFQYAFPIHQARFNYPIPKIPEPNIIFDTAQSLSAQQYYLGVVYHTVNQFADPRRQPAPARPTPNVYIPPNAQPHPQQQQQQQRMTTAQPAPSMNMQQPIPQQPQQPMQQSVGACSFKISLTQTCGRPVNHPGQFCQLHSNAPKSMAETAKAPPPPAANYLGNTCTDCHQVAAADTLYTTAKKERITDPEALVKCSNCTRKYHPICANLTTPKQVAAVESYAWLCPECKICAVCKTVGDESTLMICDGCDRGWHTRCCTPEVEHIPEGEWLCQLCAKCHGCSEQGMKDECQYTHATAPKDDKHKYPVYLATYCRSCITDFNEDRFCPVCLKTYSEEENDEEDNEMVACDTCDHWVHTRCDESLSPARYQMLCDDESAKYSCPICENRVKPAVDTDAARNALKGVTSPGGTCIGLLGGKVKARGVIHYKNIKVGVPEIDGAGITNIA
ncbi:hypothetical protein BCV72DRAFT_334199 [Rhizopus microsporus var. microsporus]|uniref:PHD-type domain-containing protein n=2 Tax=Rhizopus microsporus TaxID=58291 RepID=A0A2G4T3Q8_RHIZD|nr:uncharacterized protein RHIMIDRAFT_289988 [Rhizopus microsporus ATCC 52813]ORE08739.1 hypothetical protein BCV72DRAFT_334199 [Rhizopus microsporus var. microsporus]PHZ15629.1 hypothetical protein RHIMIDRAFT_289988 [Rhizopus microsporus ATCC 52813]